MHIKLVGFKASLADYLLEKLACLRQLKKHSILLAQSHISMGINSVILKSDNNILESKDTVY